MLLGRDGSVNCSARMGDAKELGQRLLAPVYQDNWNKWHVRVCEQGPGMRQYVFIPRIAVYAVAVTDGSYK